jgi:iron complex outermembrane receptor protein
MTKRQLLAGSAAILCIAFAGAASAQDADNNVDEVVVQARDKAGLLEKTPNDTVFGLDKALIDTPRSATFISDTTMERYGIETIDDLTAVSPGSYTASFYGVPGALNVRGTLAENYFRGFKRIENRGTYSTPIGDAAQIEIVRGPPTPIYGAGKVGGLLNFIPKSARSGAGYMTSGAAEVTATVGSYGSGGVTIQGDSPLNWGPIDGGAHGYVEYQDAGEYYHGITPERFLGEASLDFDFGGGWTGTVGGMYFHSDGDVQTPGWNRLTQDLIDHGTYITGRDTDLTDADGNGRITPGEIGFYPYGSALYLFFGSDARHQLDTGIGTTKLDHRTVYTSQADFSETTTNTFYTDVVKTFDNGQALKFQLFYDDLDNNRFVSYGYPASFQSSVWEARGTYNFDLDFSFVTAKSFVGASYRDFEGRRRESFNSGVIALDRRDIAFGATASDILDSPFNPPMFGSLQWENDNRSTWEQAGVFFTSDIYFGERLNLMIGGRYDDYDVVGHDTGFLTYTTSGRQEGGKSKGTYSASLSYKTPWGLLPYITYAEASSLEMSQAGDIAPALIANDAWLSDSKLTEGGVKFQLLQGTLVGSLAAYSQERTQLVQGIATTTVQGTESEGVELEVRWLASENFSFTLAGNKQETNVKESPGFSYLPAFSMGQTGVNAYGGSYVTFSLGSLFPSLADGYKYTLIPDTVVSLFGTYTSNKYDWGQAGATLGFTNVSETSGYVPNAVVLPSYTVVNASGFYAYGPYSVTANIDNLLDEEYFTPLGDSYSNMAALPGRGREWRVTVKRTF